MDRLEFSSSNGTENENARIVKKKRRSILKVTSNANNEREALKTIDSNSQGSGIPELPVLDNVNSKTSIATTNDEGGDRKVIFKKDKRKSLSRRVSFSSTTRVKEFHEGQHELTQWNSTYEDERSVMTPSISASHCSSGIVPYSTNEQPEHCLPEQSQVMKNAGKRNIESSPVYNQNCLDQTHMMDESDHMEETDCIQNIFDNAGHTGKIPPIASIRQNTDTTSDKKVIEAHDSTTYDKFKETNDANLDKTTHSSCKMDMTIALVESKQDRYVAPSGDDTFSSLFASAGIKKNLNDSNSNSNEATSVNSDNGMEMTCNIPLLDSLKNQIKISNHLSESPDGMEMTCRFPLNNVKIDHEKEMSSKAPKRCLSTLNENIKEIHVIPNKVLLTENCSNSEATEKLIAEKRLDTLEDDHMEMTCKISLAVSKENLILQNTSQCITKSSKDMEMTCNVPQLNNANFNHTLSQSELGRPQPEMSEKFQNDIQPRSDLPPIGQTIDSTLSLKPEDNFLSKTENNHESDKIDDSDPVATADMEITCKLPLKNSVDIYQNKEFAPQSLPESNSTNATSPRQANTGQNNFNINNEMEMTCNLFSLKESDKALKSTEIPEETSAFPISSGNRMIPTAIQDDKIRLETGPKTFSTYPLPSIGSDQVTRIIHESKSEQASEMFEVETEKQYDHITDKNDNQCNTNEMDITCNQVQETNVNEFKDITADLSEKHGNDSNTIDITSIGKPDVFHSYTEKNAPSVFATGSPVLDDDKFQTESNSDLSKCYEEENRNDKKRSLNLSNGDDVLATLESKNYFETNGSKNTITIPKIISNPRIDSLISVPKETPTISFVGKKEENMETDRDDLEKESDSNISDQNPLGLSTFNSTEVDNLNLDCNSSNFNAKENISETCSLTHCKDSKNASTALTEEINTTSCKLIHIVCPKELDVKTCQETSDLKEKNDERGEKKDEFAKEYIHQNSEIPSFTQPNKSKREENGAILTAELPVKKKEIAVYNKEPIVNDLIVERNVSIFEHLFQKQNNDQPKQRFIKENWDIRHGKWNIQKHKLTEANLTKPLIKNNGGAYNVIISFMNDTLELNITVGHPITPDVLPDIESEETLPATEETPRVINRTKITRKVLHWTLLKIEFTNPSKPMMMQLKDDEGEDVKLAHYLLLRSLTPSCLAERCPNTKHLEETLRLISKVVTDATRFTLDLGEIAGSHSFFKIISSKLEHKVLIEFHSVKQKLAFAITVDYHNGLRAASNPNSINFKPGPSLNKNLVTRDSLDQLISHILANNGDGWQFIRILVKNVDAYIRELENLVM